MIQVVVGLAFSLIWFLVFRFLIMKFNFLTPGREEDGEDAKLYTKKDYREKSLAAAGWDMPHRFWHFWEERTISSTLQIVLPGCVSMSKMPHWFIRKKILKV